VERGYESWSGMGVEQITSHTCSTCFPAANVSACIARRSFTITSPSRSSVSYASTSSLRQESTKPV